MAISFCIFFPSTVAIMQEAKVLSLGHHLKEMID